MSDALLKSINFMSRERFDSLTEINDDELYAVKLDEIYADDSEVVHRNGDETISGTKTFNDAIIRSEAFSGESPYTIRAKDTNGKGNIATIPYYTSNTIYHRILAENTTSGKSAYFDVMVKDDGTSSYAIGGSATEKYVNLHGATKVRVPTAQSDAENVEVVNVGYLNSKLGGYLPLSGGTMTGAMSMGGKNIVGVANLEFTGDGKTNGGYLDFHYANSKEDYTSRIIESAEGKINITAPNGVTVNNKNVVCSVDGVTADSAGNVVSNAVKLTGNQTINGIKTFNSTSSGGSLIQSTESTVAGAYVDFIQNINGNRRGTIRTSFNSDGSYTTIIGSNGADALAPSGISITRNNDESIIKAITPKADSNDEEIATTAWVNTRLGGTGITSTELGYLDGVTSNIQTQLNGKQASGSYVTTNSAQTISAVKTFSAIPKGTKPAATNSTTDTQIPTTGWINDPATATNVVHRTGDETIAGTKTFSSTINGTAMSALWADLAEHYETDHQYPKGTLVQFGGEKEITIATNEVNAVISSQPGLILNGNMENSQPIALVGRVPVRVIGKVNKFDYLHLSSIPGVAESVKNSEDEYPSSNVIARALESKDTEEEGLVLCVVKFEI